VNGEESFVVAALYHFVRLDDLETLRENLQQLCNTEQLKGTLLLAAEGINGTVSGTRSAIDNLLQFLRSDERFSDLQHKEALHPEHPFLRMKVKIRKEIVTMGVEEIDPTKETGTYVAPRDWNALISDPDVLLIDTRNTYETHIGKFKNAVDPETEAFTEFPDYVERELDPEIHKKVAMYCTGGIRCEKSTALLKKKGFEEVYHLRGGILKYLEEVPKEESLWEGECFVFDSRVAVNHSLRKGSYEECFACRNPISEKDQASPKYIRGVSCPHCYDLHTDQRREGFKEREKQIALARERGTEHIGVPRPPPKRKNH